MSLKFSSKGCSVRRVQERGVNAFRKHQSIADDNMGLSENRVYSQWNSHLIGIMISKTIGKMGYTIFRHTHIGTSSIAIIRLPGIIQSLTIWCFFFPIPQRKMAVLNIGTSSTAMVRPVVMFNNWIGKRLRERSARHYPGAPTWSWKSPPELLAAAATRSYHLPQQWLCRGLGWTWITTVMISSSKELPCQNLVD